MKYRLVNIVWKEAPKRFYRRLYIREDLNLVDFGVVVLTSLNATFEHEFMFYKNKYFYIPKSFIRYWKEDSMDDWEYMGDHKFIELAPCFTLEYDTGDGWDFYITVSKASKEIDSDDLAITKETKGLGIWEDNIYGLLQYIKGKRKPTSKKRGESDERFPWNLEIETFEEWEQCDQKLNKEINLYCKESMEEYEMFSKIRCEE